MAHDNLSMTHDNGDRDILLYPKVILCFLMISVSSTHFLFACRSTLLVPDVRRASYITMTRLSSNPYRPSNSPLQCFMMHKHFCMRHRKWRKADDNHSFCGTRFLRYTRHCLTKRDLQRNHGEVNQFVLNLSSFCFNHLFS